ncbi:MAG: metal-sensitive transcriptional regulator [Fimbriimonadaceae bacterium]
MKSETKASAIKRINRINGQVSGIQRMVESERACNEILQQVTAVRSALDQLGVLLLTDHLQTCVLHQDITKDGDCCSVVPDSDQATEIKDALTRFLR